MAFFILTDYEGKERSFNSENVTSITTIDKEQRLAEIQRQIRQQFNCNGSLRGAEPLEGDAKKEYDSCAADLSECKAEIHFSNGGHTYVRQTVREAQAIANMAVRDGAELKRDANGGFRTTPFVR